MSFYVMSGCVQTCVLLVSPRWRCGVKSCFPILKKRYGGELGTLFALYWWLFSVAD